MFQLTALLLSAVANTLPRQDAPPPEALSARGAWSVTVYVAAMTKEKTGDALVPPTTLEPSYTIFVAGLSRRVATLFDKLDVEVEGQVAQHFGSQDHNEINGALIGRWIRFPWNRHVATTVALGGGASYATLTPAFEALTHERTSQWLGYALLELTLAHPGWEHFAFVFRAHHRSGLDGTFNEVRGASDALGLGFKLRW